MSDRDIDELFRKFAELDAELKLLKQEVGLIKLTLEPKKQWEEDIFEDDLK